MKRSHLSHEGGGWKDTFYSKNTYQSVYAVFKNWGETPFTLAVNFAHCISAASNFPLGPALKCHEWTIWQCARFECERLGTNQSAGLVVVNIVACICVNLI